MRRTPLFLLVLLTAIIVAFPTQPSAQASDAFTRLLSEVSAYRGRGFTLSLSAGVLAWYSRRMEDVSEARYTAEAAALAGFAARLEAIDRTTLPAETQLDAEILSRQLRDRRQELRFRAFEIPIGSREGFHFELPAVPDRYSFDTVGQYDNYIATLQSFGEHSSQRIAMLRRPVVPSVIVETHQALDPADADRWREPTTWAAFGAALARGVTDALAPGSE